MTETMLGIWANKTDIVFGHEETLVLQKEATPKEKHTCILAGPAGDSASLPVWLHPILRDFLAK